MRWPRSTATATADEDCNDDDLDQPGRHRGVTGDNNCDGEVTRRISTTWMPTETPGSEDEPREARPARGRGGGRHRDDTDPTIFPGATEVCDGVDNNCDGEVDEGVTSTFYLDADGDAFGSEDEPREACSQPADAVAVAGDCDDTDPTIFPGATEVCDGVDNNCDGEVDEGVTETFHADTDGDGFGNPDAPLEACEQPSGFVADSSDCDDSTAAANPGAAEVCDELDNDCDGDVDEPDAVDAATWYGDGDGDGYGDPDVTAQGCSAPSATVDNADDCDDRAVDINPAAVEVCDGVDNDCDGQTDDADASLDTTTGSTFYTDSDSDGYGDAGAPTQACVQPSGTVADATDCDDGDGSVNPGATEVCNGTDDDCDTDVDEGVLGAGASCPADSCDAVLTDQPTAADDTYWLEGSSGAVFEAWCDMTVDNGGWTLIGSIVNDGTRRWNSTAVFTGSTTFGSMGNSQSADFKSEAWSEIGGWDLLIQTDDYDMGFYSVLLGDEMSTWLTSEYDASACNETWYASGADYADGLTTAQAAAQGVIVRPRDTNATCFPGSNENALLGFHNATCCWAGGLGNAPNGHQTWRQHDLSLVQSSTMSVSSCTAGTYPCNDNGRVLDNSSFCYGTSCKVTWAEVYVR